MFRAAHLAALAFFAFACSVDDTFVPVPCSDDSSCYGFVCLDGGLCSTTCTDGCAAGYQCPDDGFSLACVLPSTGTDAGVDTGTGVGGDTGPPQCTTDEQCFPAACETLLGLCYTACANASQCAGGAQCDILDGEETGSCLEGGGLAQAYHVAILSLAEGSVALDNQNPGPDLDAITVSSGGVEQSPSSVLASNQGPFGEDNTRPLSSHAEAVFERDTIGAGPSDCDLDAQPGYVSLGGVGGFIVAEFDEPLRTGDVVTVYEINSDSCADAATERPDAYEVYVETSSAPGSAEEISDEWCFVGVSAGLGGTTSFTLNLANCP